MTNSWQPVWRKTRKLRVGKGSDPDVEVGPMIHQRQLQIVEAQVNEAKAAGARVLCGGERLSQLGPNFYAPTVIADLNHSMRLLQEETFGPVLPIMPFDSEDEAIRLANDSDFGLAASVWTRDRQRGEAIAKQIHAGTVMVNDVICGFGISEAPHGGVKVQRTRPYSRQTRSGRNGAGEVPRQRSHAAHEEALVVRL